MTIVPTFKSPTKKVIEHFFRVDVFPAPEPALLAHEKGQEISGIEFSDYGDREEGVEGGRRLVPPLATESARVCARGLGREPIRILDERFLPRCLTERC